MLRMRSLDRVVRTMGRAVCAVEQMTCVFGLAFLQRANTFGELLPLA